MRRDGVMDKGNMTLDILYEDNHILVAVKPPNVPSQPDDSGDADMTALKLPEALASIFELVGACNKYIDVTRPWILAKDEATMGRLGTVMYNLSECLRFTGVLLAPFLTHTSPELLRQLGVIDPALTTVDSLAFGKLPANTRVNKGEALFPRIDVKKELEELEKETAAAHAAAAAANAPAPAPAAAPAEAKKEPDDDAPPAEITYDDFAKLDLRLAKVVACEPVKRSDHLLNLTLEVGEETRTVLSGIKDWYTPEDIIGKTVVLVYNLKPRKMCGIESRGMILCASDAADVKLSALTTLAPMESGLKVR